VELMLSMEYGVDVFLLLVWIYPGKQTYRIHMAELCKYNSICLLDSLVDICMIRLLIVNLSHPNPCSYGSYSS